MNIATSYLGFRLPHTFIAGASPLGYDLDAIKHLEDGGCAATVIPSLFEEQIGEAPDDGVKALLAGADTVQMVSALLRHGPGYFRVMLEGLERWMEAHGLMEVGEMRGSASLARTPYPRAFERASDIRTMHSWSH
jgi:dihydroorotate dehydrogenase